MGIELLFRLTCQGALLAQAGPIHDISSGFSGAKARLGTHDAIVLALSVVFAIAILAIVSRLVQLHAKRHHYHSPMRLYLSLCRAHRLRWSQMILLWRVAETQGLRDPARLFLEPERLAMAARTREYRARGAELRAIHDRIFAPLGVSWLVPPAAERTTPAETPETEKPVEVG